MLITLNNFPCFILEKLTLKKKTNRFAFKFLYKNKIVFIRRTQYPRSRHVDYHISKPNPGYIRKLELKENDQDLANIVCWLNKKKNKKIIESMLDFV